ncbi:MAG: hypothetical protein V1727_06125 [Candidatus Omnitrophota bacterium]
MKWSPKALVLTVLFSSVSLVCLAASGARSKTSVAFNVSLDKAEYAPGEPIQVTFSLKNNGSKAIYINNRFNVSAEKSDPGNREVYFQVTDPSGKALPCKVDYDIGFPKSDYFALLEPNSEISAERQFNLQAYFDFQALGTYQVRAVYNNIYGQEIGLDTLKGPLAAKPLSLKISAPQPSTENP